MEILRPDGFSQLIVHVIENGRSAAGARLEIPEEADAILNGTPDEEGRALTGSSGKAAFYVRPTRQVLIKAVSPKTGWSAEATFTSPFEGRTRTVELDLSSGASGQPVSICVVSEMDGAPLVGVQVELLGSGAIATEASTNDAGVALVPRAGTLEYRLAIDGYVTKEVRVEDSEAERLVELRPLTRLYGTIAPTRRIPAKSGGASANRDVEAWEAILRERGVGGSRSSAGGRVMVTAPELWAKMGQEIQFTSSLSGQNRSGSAPAQHPWIGAVRSDGVWSVDIAIPEDHETLSNVRLDQLTSRGGRRLLGNLPLIRPGDSIQVDDAWGSAPPFAVRFATPGGEPAAAGKTVEFRSLTRGASALEAATSAAPAASGPVRSDGRVLLSQLPRGRWSYRMIVPGAPPSWSPVGEVLHNGQDGPVEVTLDGSPLTVQIAHQGKSRNLRFYQLAIVEAGGSLGGSISVRAGSTYTFPVIPKDGSWEAVLFTQEPQLEEGEFELRAETILRVPVMREEPVLSLAVPRSPESE